MRPASSFAVVASVALALAAAAVWQPPVGGQSARRSAASAVNPRTPDGHPDFQGTYDLATLTPLERPAAFGHSQTVTREQAAALEKQAADRRVRADQPLDKDPPPPPIRRGRSTRGAG